MDNTRGRPSKMDGQPASAAMSIGSGEEGSKLRGAAIDNKERGESLEEALLVSGGSKLAWDYIQHAWHRPSEEASIQRKLGGSSRAEEAYSG